MLDTKTQAQNIDLDNYLAYSQNTDDDDQKGKEDKDDDDGDEEDEDDDDCEGDGVWKLKGNKLKCPEQYFGTKSYDDLIFKTNALERFRITKDGDFIFAPNLSLTFPNGASFDSIGTNTLFTNTLQVGNLSGTGTALLKVTSNGNIGRFPITNNTNHYLKGDGNFGLGAFSVSGNTVYSNNTGFVGIGTSNPIEKLHVAGNIKFDGNLMNSIIHSDKTTGEVTVDGKLIANDAQVNGLLKVGTGTLILDGSNTQTGPANTIRTDNGNLKIQAGSFYSTAFSNKVSIGTAISTSSGMLTISNNTNSTSPELQILRNPASVPQNTNILEIIKGNVIGSLTYPFVIADTGSIGVSQETPLDRLHLSNGALRIDGNSNLLNPITPSGLRLGTFFNTTYIQSYATNNNLDINPLGGNIRLASISDFGEDGGNVGIGLIRERANQPEQQPQAKLHIVGSSIPPTFDADAIIVDHGNFGSPSFKVTSAGYVSCLDLTAYSGIQIIKKGTTDERTFRVTQEGELYARKIKVTLNAIPDYVFDKKYKLMNLLDLRKFINKYKHLPNVPSAKEVVNNNNEVDLGEMQKVMLEKIEELTLYIIKLDDEMKNIKKENLLLKKSLQHN